VLGPVRSQEPSGAVGIFEGTSDVGTVLHAGTAKYDSTKSAYTLIGSGENMWEAADDFHFVWKKVSGDVTLAADIAILGTGGDPHRKAILVVRQSLAPDSSYADAALHGNGLASLQVREHQGANTYEIQSNVTAPRRLRIAKRGNLFYISVAAAGEPLRFSGGAVKVAMTAPFYVGIGVCAHNKDAVQAAEFSNVDLKVSPAGESGTPGLYSTIESVPAPAGDRRVTYAGPGRMMDPVWTRDGASIVFCRGDELEQVPAGGGAAKAADSGSLRRCSGAAVSDNREHSPDGKTIYFNSDRTGVMQIWRMRADGSGQEQVTGDDYANWFPHVSPDGRRLAFLSCDKEVKGAPQMQDVTLRVLTIQDGSIRTSAHFLGGWGSMDSSSWSPDGRRLAFVSYQMLPAD
jgi:TolB protein